MGRRSRTARRRLEFEALVKRAGLTPARAIQAGTTVNAEVLGWQDRIGSIDKGKYADLIAVSGDPAGRYHGTYSE